MKIQTTKDLQKYIYDRFRWDKNKLQFEELDGDCPGFRLKLYTDRHRYNITAIDASSSDKKSYLGCTVSCRAPYPGEKHTRGNDLPDGELNMNTWNYIMEAIVKFESLPIYKPKGEPIIDGE